MVELVTVGWISPSRCFGLAEWMAAVTSRFLPAEPSSRRPYSIGPKSGFHFSEESDAITM